MTAPPIITEIIGSPSIFPEEGVVVVVVGAVVVAGVVVVLVGTTVAVVLGVVGVELVVVVIIEVVVVAGWTAVVNDVSADHSDHIVLLSWYLTRQ